MLLRVLRLAGFCPASTGVGGSAVGHSAIGHGRGHPAVLLVGLHQGLEGSLGFLTAESFLGLP